MKKITELSRVHITLNITFEYKKGIDLARVHFKSISEVWKTSKGISKVHK